MSKHKCKTCGKELDYIADECGECAKKGLQKIFKENPELKKCFKEALEETFSPENREKMASDITNIMRVFQATKNKNRKG